MNQNSTRSHCIFTIMLEKRMPGADSVIRSKLNIVDLAGSERVSRTTSSAGQTSRSENTSIPRLFFLEMVIVALIHGEISNNVHVPYRNSMMTSVLRDSLGGKTTMIATISPEAQFTDESVSTCHFAQRVALVKNSASVNEEVEPELVIQRLRAEVRRLREEVEFLSRKNDDDEGDGGEKQIRSLSQQQMSELTESVHKYVQDNDNSSHLDFCGGITLPRIRAVCSIFKDFLLRKPNERIVDDDTSNSDDESLEKNERSFTPKNKAIGQNVREEGRSTTQAPSDNRSEKGDRSKGSNCVCGVPLCSDQRVITEPNLAFAWFKDRYPGTAAIDDSKNLLKTKISEVYYFYQKVECRFYYSLNNSYATNNHLLLIQAKNTGRTIEEIRSRIRQHKEAIEKVRASHALSMVSGREEKLSECVEDKLHCDAIIKEKVAPSIGNCGSI
ncbi:hypothetical protein ACHAW5_002482 [Stephanodiscus triporus]|uniref:Kinesin-like protein n=1 Tax=Stephanodiscus triporus TaxID=2934178 RepID=A0ABD3QJU6_9STRA